MTIEDYRQEISFYKTELMPFFNEFKTANNKEALNLLMYVYYQDVLREYKKLKAMKTIQSVDQQKLAELNTLYTDITQNPDRYQGGMAALAGVSQKLSAVFGDKFAGIKNGERFSKLGSEINLLRSKFGKDLEAALADVKTGIIESFGIDDTTAQALVADQQQCHSISTASNDYVRAKSMGIDTIGKFSTSVADVFKYESARGDFNVAYTFFSNLLTDYAAKRGPGDVTEYPPDFVNNYVEYYNANYEPFDLLVYGTVDEAAALLQDALSKKQYGNALVTLVDLLNAQAKGLDQQTNEIVSFMKQNLATQEMTKGFAALETHLSETAADSIKQLVDASEYGFYSLESIAQKYRENKQTLSEITEMFKTAQNPKFLHTAMAIANEAIPERFAGERVTEFYNGLVKAALLTVPFYKTRGGKRMCELLKASLNADLLADKSDEECKKYYSENYLQVRSLLDQMNKALKAAKEVEMLPQDLLDNLAKFAEVRMPPLLKEGEALYIQKLDGVELPSDQYNGPDKMEIKMAVAEHQNRRYPDEKVVGVIITSPDWQLIENEKWRFSGDTATKYIEKYRYMSGYTITEKGDPFYWAYPVGIHSDPYQNSWGKAYVGGALSSNILFLSKKNVEAAGLLLK